MGGSVSNFVDDTIGSVKKAAKDTVGSLNKKNIKKAIKGATSYAVNPLIMQDVEFSRLVGGGEVGASSEALADPRAYLNDPKNQRDLITGNAMLAAGAAGGAGGMALAIPEAGFVAIPGVAASAAAGGALGAATGKAVGDITGQMVAPDALQLPDTGSIAMEAAGPAASTSADLSNIVRQRQRRGRAGTILTAGQTLGGTSGGKTLLGA